VTEIIDFINFVELERQAQESESLERGFIDNKALEWLGHAIRNLDLVQINENVIIFSCPTNKSKFRPGDRLVFTHLKKASIKGILHGISENGSKLVVQGTAQKNNIGTTGWTATEDYADLSFSTQTALRKIQAGAPGWTYAQRIIGKTDLPESSIYQNKQKQLAVLLEETKMEFDLSQKEAFLKCICAPPIIGIQGPPGTGKTLVLAFVAEAMIRSKKRVVILAPTHQAVNNALTTLKRLFPERTVKKFGDELRTESLDGSIPIITSPKVISKEAANTIVGFTYMSAIHQLMISDQKMVAPHAMIIDEAGQLPVTQGLCAGLSGAGSIMLFGDDMQMPPVFPGDLSEEPLAISTFAQLRKNHPHAIHMLNKTYRMNQELCTAIGSTFYGETGKTSLNPSDEAKDRTFQCILSPDDKDKWLIELLQSKNSLIWHRILTRNKTQYNSDETEAASKIIHTCIKNGMQPNDMAVVTPFRRQAMQIRNRLKEMMGNTQEIPIVDTVERVQGLTVEMIVVSVCASEPNYVAEIAEFLFSPNRMNVAISRARSKAVIIASPNIFEVTPKTVLGLKFQKTCGKLFLEHTPVVFD